MHVIKFTSSTEEVTAPLIEMEDASTPIFINSFEYFELFCDWLNAKNKKTKYRKNLILYKQTKLKLIVYIIIITKLVYYFYI